MFFRGTYWSDESYRLNFWFQDDIDVRIAINFFHDYQNKFWNGSNHEDDKQ